MESISKENNYKFSQVTNSSQVNEIKGWLLEEYNDTGEGFYCNWKIVHRSINAGFCLILSYLDHPIGFLIWNRTSEFTARIEVAEIKPSHRGLKAGKAMVTLFLKYLTANNILVVDLECSPSSSEPFWKKMGFIEFPDIPDFIINGDQRLYILLTEALSSSQHSKSESIFELWMKEPNQVLLDEEPAISWNLTFSKDSRLLRPIVYPAKCDWRIRWRNKTMTLADCKVKHFMKEIGHEDFIVVYELPEVNEFC